MDGPNGVFADLLTIDVSTIIKDSMTAHKMPSLPFALLDIIESYARALVELEIDLEPYLRATSAELWQALSPNEEYVQRANAARLAVHGELASTPAERADLYHYVTDLWPVLERKHNRWPSTPGWRFSMLEVSNGWDSFERLRIAAHEALDERSFNKAEQVLLSRITGSCARLKFIVQGLQRREPSPARKPWRKPWRKSSRYARELASWDELIPRTRNQLLHGDLRDKDVPLEMLRPDQRATIRKIWEVGTERVVVQTSVHVDGDVVTRISDDLIERHDEAVRGLILQAHRHSIDTGLSHWQAIVDVAIRLFSGFLRRRSS